MKTTAMVLISALLGAGTVYLFENSRPEAVRDDGASQRDVDYLEVALEGSQERTRELQRTVRRLHAEIGRLEAEAAEPGPTRRMRRCRTDAMRSSSTDSTGTRSCSTSSSG